MDGKTSWDGVRNFQARNNLRSMQVGEKVFFYHSNEGLEIVGVAEVASSFYQDPTTDDPNWVVVDLKPLKPLKHPVTLAAMKEEPRLSTLALVRQGRLSVSPVTDEEFKVIMEMAGKG